MVLGAESEHKESWERGKMVLKAELEAKSRKNSRIGYWRIGFWSHFIFLNSLLPQLILNFFLHKGNFTLLITLGGLKITIEIKYSVYLM